MLPFSLQNASGFEFLRDHPAMKAIVDEVKCHPSILHASRPEEMRAILRVDSVPFATKYHPQTDFCVLFLSQRARLSAEDFCSLMLSYEVVRCCAQCFSFVETLRPCRGCGMVRYCSQSCHDEHRPEHGAALRNAESASTVWLFILVYHYNTMRTFAQGNRRKIKLPPVCKKEESAKNFKPDINVHFFFLHCEEICMLLSQF